VARLNQKLLALVTLYLCETLALGNTQALSLGTAASSTNIVSTSYKAKSNSSVDIDARFSHGISNRWSLFGQYQGAIDTTLTRLIVGASFDSAPLMTKSGSLNIQSGPEVERVPKWLFRFSAGLGLFQFSDTLESSNKDLGTKNEVGVEAELYGFSFDAGVYRFFNSEWAAYLKLTESIASAGSFGLNSLSIGAGIFWRFN
jgi:hypothetical protein